MKRLIPASLVLFVFLGYGFHSWAQFNLEVPLVEVLRIEELKFPQETVRSVQATQGMDQVQVTSFSITANQKMSRSYACSTLFLPYTDCDLLSETVGLHSSGSEMVQRIEFSKTIQRLFQEFRAGYPSDLIVESFYLENLENEASGKLWVNKSTGQSVEIRVSCQREANPFFCRFESP
jgi:hypothetical protein